MGAEFIVRTVWLQWGSSSGLGSRTDHRLRCRGTGDSRRAGDGRWIYKGIYHNTKSMLR